ncbi:MAG: VWA domain-containing protein [Treponema sp.]|nr:VWA domain-containing protein [Treponema sp.]
MSLNEAVEAIPRKSMVLFFLIDTSGSMSGSKIGAVNAAIEEVIPELKDISANNADAEVKIAALEFSHSASWITSAGPVPVDDFSWRYVDAGGNTAMGEAFHKLNEALSTKTFMQDAVGSFAPAIFMLSDGEPTDDFAGGLAELKTNNWFKAAIKVAVAIGDDANKNRLAEFTGSMESVLEVHNAAMLRKMIKFVSVRASQVASKSVQVNSIKPAAIAVNGQDNENQAVDATAAPVKQAALNEQLAQIKAEAAAGGDDEW